MTYSVCWNEAKTIGVIVKEDDEHKGLTYELRKGALNTLGVVTPDFMDAWGDMTAEDNCTIETVELPNIPLELLMQVLNQAEVDNYAVEYERSCGEHDKKLHKAERAKIDELRKIAGIE